MGGVRTALYNYLFAKQNGGASPPSAPAPAPDAAEVSVSEAPAEAEKPDGE